MTDTNGSAAPEEQATQQPPAPVEEALKDETYNPVSARYEPAMEILGKEQADAYLAKLADTRMQESKCGIDTAVVVERANLAYYAATKDHDTRLRVEALFRCEHPLYGAAADGELTIPRAWMAGFNYAKRHFQHVLNNMNVNLADNNNKPQ